MFISTLDTSPHLAMDKRWRYIGLDCAYVLGVWGLLKLLMLINIIK